MTHGVVNSQRYFVTVYPDRSPLLFHQGKLHLGGRCIDRSLQFDPHDAHCDTANMLKGPTSISPQYMQPQPHSSWSGTLLQQVEPFDRLVLHHSVGQGWARKNLSNLVWQTHGQLRSAENRPFNPSWWNSREQQNLAKSNCGWLVVYQ